MGRGFRNINILEWLDLNYEQCILRNDFIALFGLCQNHNLEDMEDEYYLESLLSGICLILSYCEKKITEIQIHSGLEKSGEFQTYTNKIPFGLSFEMNKNNVHSLLGNPYKSGEKTIDPILGRCPPWDLYKQDQLEICLLYTDDQQAVESITIRLK